MAALLLLSLHLSAQTVIEFNNPSGSRCRAGDASPCVATDNRVKFNVITQRPDSPPPPPSTIVPRFEAFWITGDGNYWDFPRLDDDAASLSPTETYNYEKPGDYTVSVYLTGKYTNHNPPPGAARAVNVGPNGGTRAHTPTAFRRKAGSGEYDFFPMHPLRRDYLTPLVLSYPANLDTTWCYLFFNGKPTGAPWPSKPLKFKKSAGETANYFKGDKNKIQAYDAGALSSGIDGIIFKPGFAGFQNLFSDLVYFPQDLSTAADLPQGFVQKRFFPLFWADSSETAKVIAPDTLMRFCMIVTSTSPLPQAQAAKLSSQLGSMGLDLNVSAPINDFSTSIDFNSSQFQQPGPIGPLQYIQGVYINDVQYVQAHDPNQLTVIKITQQPNGKYLVTFHLEICNKGADDTEAQKIELLDRFGHFSNFVFQGNTLRAASGSPNTYRFDTGLRIYGIPYGEYKMDCESIDFTAETDCDGIRALWNENALQACVQFVEGPFVECGGNRAIDTCEFKIDNACLCVKPVKTCGGDDWDWMLIFVLLLVLALLLWKLLSKED